ncbi:HTH-type transcriptional regulator SrpS [Roseovarius sp. A-2]|nr:HTH-type transcriptional regulator SrpS [Roseovarius sp. A-2]
MAPSQSSKSNSSNTLNRALRLMRMLCEAPTPLSLTKIAKTLEVDAGNLHRLLQSLQDDGWVSRVYDGAEYTVGPLLMNNFDPWHPVHNFRRESYPFLKQLHEQTRETSALILFLGTQRVVMDAIHGQLTLSSYYDVQLSSPVHGSASGKILLASLPAGIVDEVLGGEPLPKYTEFTPTTRDDLDRHLIEIRETRYCISREEAFNGIVAYGAPIQYRGRVLGCLVSTAASADIATRDDASFATKLRDVANLLSASVPSIHQMKFFLTG